MVDNMVLLEDDKKYVILDEKVLNNVKYYYGLRLTDKEIPTNMYLFFKESTLNDETYLTPVIDENMKKVLLTTFTVNYLDRVYDNI